MNERLRQPLIIVGFLLTGFIFRLYPLNYNNVINPDGVRYINQAKALLEGNFDLALQCGFEFISIYHLLVPLFHYIFADWILAAKSINLLFGTLIIVPFYLIAKQFYREPVVIATTLAFAISPFLVSHSEDVIRGPIFWFFALFGIYFFITVINNKGSHHLLILSCLSFLIAGWARFEVILYIIGSLLYIPFIEKERLKKLFFFSLPIIVLSLFALPGLIIYKKGFGVWSFYLGPRMAAFFWDFLTSVMNGNIFTKSFLATTNILFRLVRVYSSFLIFLLPGLLAIKRELNRNRNLGYFILLSALSLAGIFILHLKVESIVDRYVAIIMLPSFIFICAGMEEIITFFKTKGFTEKKIVYGICLFIIITVAAFPHNLVHKRKDQMVYKEIGNYISRLEKNQLVKVMARDSRVSFFANLKSTGIECTENNSRIYDNLVQLEYPGMAASLKEMDAKYFLWEKSFWNNAPYDFLAVARTEHFKEITRWDTGRRKLILFKTISNNNT